MIDTAATPVLEPPPEVDVVGLPPQEVVPPTPEVSLPEPEPEPAPAALPPTSEAPAAIEVPIDTSAVAPPSFDAWELDEELRHIQRILTVEQAEVESKPAMDLFTRLDAAHVRSSHRAKSREQNTRTTATASRPGAWLSTLISFVLSLGLMAFAFGGVLLAWSFLAGRQDLWTFGMPIALAGQIILLMGFILQMDRLWHDQSKTAVKLEHVDERLLDLKATTDLLGNGPAGLSDLYPAPMTGSLDSQLMLADLKSQLDLLALKIGNQTNRPTP